MGIPRLTRHLAPYAEPVRLTNIDYGSENVKCIKSVVIDGPALVYYIHYSLLSWMDDCFNPVDAQPSCDEVSIGVMHFLLYLRDLNINVVKICFDGALPITKRETRLERLEKSRQKLEILFRDTAGGFKIPSIRRTRLGIDSKKVFRKRPLPARFKAVTETPFMIPTVIDDLKYRWNWANILDYAPGSIADAPAMHCLWADVTEIVPAEADIYCAEAARNSGAAVLTGDSDLLVHDLGGEGSVIFFDSIEAPDHGSGMGAGIGAMELSPTTIASKLGVVSIQRLAFELKRDPSTTFSTIVQRSKSTSGSVESSASYLSFMKEYHPLDIVQVSTMKSSPDNQILDPRISELYFQYLNPYLDSKNEAPHIYLPILIEHHDRQAAWLQGSEIRSLTYSILNQSFPVNGRHQTIVEHLRRGRRIYPKSITLYTQKEIERGLAELLKKLSSVRSNCEDGPAGCDPWRSFAIYEILSRMDPEDRPSLGHMVRFLEQNYTGDKLAWDDIHLNAQIQSVLYSLKIMKDLSQACVSSLDGSSREMTLAVIDAMADFPPLRILTKARREAVNQEKSETQGHDRQHMQNIYALVEEQNEEDPPEQQMLPRNGPRRSKDNMSAIEDGWETSRSKRKRKKVNSVTETSGNKPKVKATANLYELLGGTD